MERILNFRDLGGTETEDGRRVKKGLFFRCAMLEEATKNDVKELNALGVKLVFDYRNPGEVPGDGGYPYNQIGAMRFAFPMLTGKNKLYRLQTQSNLKRAFSRVSIEDVKDTYRALPFGNEGYKRMAKALTDGETPFIQHCSAGKDRTGVGSAILLGILGVSFAEILKDYLKSGIIENEIREKAAQQLPRFLGKWFKKKFGLLFGVRAELLEAALDDILKRYGSFQKYILDEFGLTTEAVKELRGRYTE